MGGSRVGGRRTFALKAPIRPFLQLSVSSAKPGRCAASPPEGNALRLKQIFGANVRAVRKARGWSQAQLGERVGLSANGVSKIERGKTAPSFNRAERIAAAFDLEPTMLFSPTPPVTPAGERARRLERMISRVSRVEDEKLAEVERAVMIVVG